MRPELPTGRVTFLFTDIEGSTRLLHSLGTDAYRKALDDHRAVVREAIAGHGGVEVDTQGDAFFVAFRAASDAVEAADEIRDRLAGGPMQARMGIHTGTPNLASDGYVGSDVHLAARIAAAGHGGQILLSAATRVDAQAEAALDLGEHRLKDFDDPVSIFQLPAGRFPPLRTVGNSNLPRLSAPLVGRSAETARIRELIASGHRLVSLTGPGGIGKTRLAMAAAVQLIGEFRAGVFWVDLSAVRDQSLVEPTIGETIGAKTGLAEHIGARELLLILDNVEQVVGAGPRIGQLSAACPNLALIVTSREALKVAAESEFAVPALQEAEAVDLFCRRSGLEADDTITALVRQLDNLPLAIELAAGRATVLTPAEMAERLPQRLDVFRGGRDAVERQQTLRATIEWSHQLLTPEEQGLFARLAVFEGGSSVEAAERVAGASLDVLQSLVDKSLVTHRAGRFSMLESIHEFARERFDGQADPDRIKDAHSDWYLQLVVDGHRGLEGGDQARWLARMVVDNANIRAALERAIADGRADRALRLAGSCDLLVGGGPMGRRAAVARAGACHAGVRGSRCPGRRARGSRPSGGASGRSRGGRGARHRMPAAPAVARR